MILENAGLSVPYYAGLSRMNALLGHHRPLIVVYTDQMAHRGEGKEFCTLHSGTADKYPDSRDLLTSIWIDNEGGGAVSYRYLRIGDMRFGLMYTSDDRRFSNRGNVQIEMYPSLVGSINYIALPNDFIDPDATPMMAIDFVRSIGGMWWAVDYNTSPGIKGTPVMDVLTPQDIVDLVKDWFIEHPR